MKLRGLLVATLLLAALAYALYWSNRHPATEPENPAVSLHPLEKMLALNRQDITQVTIRHKGQPASDLVRSGAGGAGGGSGEWRITAPQSLPADEEAVSGVLSTVSLLNSERVVQDQAGDLAPFGLATPELEVDVTVKDKPVQKLMIGSQTPAGTNYYAMLGGDSRLFTVSSTSKNSLDKTANDLRDKRLLSGDFDKVSQMELLVEHPGASSAAKSDQKKEQKPAKRQDIVFARDKDEWQILKPGPFRADGGAVDQLIQTLREAKMDLNPNDAADSSAAFRGAAPFAMAKISGASGTQELEIRKSKDDYYAKSSALPGAYKVAASLGSGLDKTLDDFRNKKLFDFAYQEPAEVEIHDDGKSVFLTHAGSDWWGADGKKLDEGSVQAVLDKLRDLSADGFAESGFGPPIMVISVTSADSKKVEKVQLARHGENYLAKRENEPALYEIRAAAVADLQKAAGEVKAATPPAPAPAKK